MDVIIVGGGIAGLSAAIGLRRAGHRVTVLEQSSLMHETGAAITMGPNATRVLQTWDFKPERSKMVALKIGSILDGATLDMLDANVFEGIEERYGMPSYSAHRVDLHSQLRELATVDAGTGRPADVQTRSKVVEYDAGEGKVRLEDGRTLHGDLIVAADGVHSGAVTHVLGGAADRASSTEWGAMRWLVPTEELLADPQTAALVRPSAQRYFTGKQHTGALVWYPCRNNEVQNFLYLSQSFDTDNAIEDFRATIEPQVLNSHAAEDFNPALQAVIAKARDVRFWKLVARQPASHFFKDRLVLIGDAAHPMLPFQAQGGAQAIEDGAALEAIFTGSASSDSLADRLRLFEQPQSVRDAASQYLPGNKTLKTMGEVMEYVHSFDVVKESHALLA